MSRLNATQSRQSAGALCVLLAAGAHHWMESSMLTHMLLQLPLLVLAGWLLLGRSRRLSRVATVDEYGLTVLTGTVLVGAYWMIPRALEQSINEALPEAAKFASLMLCGALLPGALRRARLVIQLFFLGNFCWMTAIVGIQYQDMPQRLCNAYLLDDQLMTGIGLVIASVLIAILWCVRHAPALLSNPTTTAPHHASPGTES